MREKKFIILHHVGAGTVKASQNYRGKHYDFLVLKDGSILPRRNIDIRGAHCLASNMNAKALSISFADNFSLHMPSNAQLEGAVLKVKELMCKYNIPIQNVLVHKEVRWAATQCPGNFFDMNIFRSLLREVQMYCGEIPCDEKSFCQIYPVLKVRYPGESVSWKPRISPKSIVITIDNASEKEKMWIDEKVREMVNAKVYWSVK